MTLERYAIITLVLLADFCYLAESVPVFEYDVAEGDVPVVYIRAKRSDAIAFSGATASASGGSIPFDAGIIPKIARGDFSNLHDFQPPSLPPGAEIFSRFGEGEGESVHVSGSAQGPSGAFSATSAAADGTGKVQYSVKSARY